jgi:hypothetical protein
MDISFYKRGLDKLGGFVDGLFLTIPRILKPMKPVRDIDRNTYEKEVDFYIENGYADHPGRFFDFPDTMPGYQVVEEMPFDDGKRQLVSFKSGYEVKNPLKRNSYYSHQSNHTGYLVRWTHGNKGRKTVLCLHGYMLGDPDQAEKMFRIRNLYRMGLDVSLFITPFHWRRAPESRRQRGIFLQPDDVAMTCECFGQAMYDLYSSIQILADMGSHETGIIGASLGGYIAALFACLSNRISFTAMMVPSVNLSKPFGPGFIKMPFQVDPLLGEKLDRVWGFHSPLNLKPRIAGENILVIASRGDRLCPFEHVRLLCEKWGWPPHRFMTGGHWLVFNGKARGKAWYRFLADKGFI